MCSLWWWSWLWCLLIIINIIFITSLLIMTWECWAGTSGGPQVTSRPSLPSLCIIIILNVAVIIIVNVAVIIILIVNNNQRAFSPLPIIIIVNVNVVYIIIGNVGIIKIIVNYIVIIIAVNVIIISYEIVNKLSIRGRFIWPRMKFRYS